MARFRGFERDKWQPLDLDPTVPMCSALRKVSWPSWLHTTAVFESSGLRLSLARLLDL